MGNIKNIERVAKEIDKEIGNVKAHIEKLIVNTGNFTIDATKDFIFLKIDSKMETLDAKDSVNFTFYMRMRDEIKTMFDEIAKYS